MVLRLLVSKSLPKQPHLNVSRIPGHSNTIYKIRHKSGLDSESTTSIMLHRAEGGSPSYLLIYTLLVASAVIVNTGYFTMFTFGQLRASRSLHRRLLDSVLATTWRYVLQIIPSRPSYQRSCRQMARYNTFSSVGYRAAVLR